MRIRHLAAGSTFDSEITVEDPDATVADLAEAIGAQPGSGLWVDGQLVRPACPLDLCGLHEGSTVSLDAPPRPRPAAGRLTATVTGGLDAGRRFELGAGEHLVVRAGAEIRPAPPAGVVTLAIRDPTVSARHLAVDVRADGSVLVDDLGSTNGTWHQDRALDGPTLVGPGQELRLGAARLRFDLIDPVDPV